MASLDLFPYLEVIELLTRDILYLEHLERNTCVQDAPGIVFNISTGLHASPSFGTA